MTDFSREILSHFQIRKTKKQKAAFRERLVAYAAQHGYASREEKGSLGARNVIVGDPERARVVFTAHYDTCPVLPVPNFITPKRFSLYLLYQLLLTLGILGVIFLAEFAVGFGIGLLLSLVEISDTAVDILIFVSSYCVFIALFALLLFGPANRHTANDNTSGVITLCELIAAFGEKYNGSVAFIFFDLEEVGLLGSSSYAAKHKTAMKGKLLLNFDCVSDGEHVLLALRRGAKLYEKVLSEAFVPSDTCTVELLSRGVFYPSDQMAFDGGVGVAALKYSKLFKTHYMDRIHTPRDTVFREENITYLTECSLALVKLLEQPKGDQNEAPSL